MVNHVSSKKEMNVLIGVDEEEADAAEDVLVEQVGKEDDRDTINISLNSVVGIDNPKTMKLVGKTRNEEVIVLIDPGATNNSISTLAV